MIRPDSLSGNINQAAVDLPGFSLQGFNAGIVAGNNNLDISDLNLDTELSEISLNLEGTFNNFSNLINDLEQSAFQLSMAGHINKADINYFLGDSVVKYISSWPLIQMETDTRYESGIVDITEFSFGVGNSHFLLDGILTNVLSGQDIAWENLNITTRIGNDFEASIQQFTSSTLQQLNP